MTPTIFLATVTLITVTHDGHVGALKFDTPRMCEQAKSLATTGLTLEDAKKRSEREAEFYRSQWSKGRQGVLMTEFTQQTQAIKTAECVTEEKP